MAKTTTTHQQAARNMKSLAISMLGSGLGVFALTAAIVASDEKIGEEALAQQSFVDGRCTVSHTDVYERRLADDSRDTIMTVTFVVHAPDGDVPNVLYEYPDYWWNPTSAAQATSGTHAAGASLPCFFDPGQPAHAVLVRRSPPAPDQNSPWVLAGIIGGPLLLFGLMGLVIKPDPNARRSDD